jgi:thioredoxin 1
MAELLTITEQNFEEEVLKSPIPVMIDFWAEWCGPCKMLGPAVEEVATEYNGKLKVGKLDVDSNQNLAQKYGVMSIPRLIFFRNGSVVDQKIGFCQKKEIIKYVDKVLA